MLQANHSKHDEHSPDTQVFSLANLWQSIDLLSVSELLPWGSCNSPIDASPLDPIEMKWGAVLYGFVPHAHKAFLCPVRWQFILLNMSGSKV